MEHADGFQLPAKRGSFEAFVSADAQIARDDIVPDFCDLVAVRLEVIQIRPQIGRVCAPGIDREVSFKMEMLEERIEENYFSLAALPDLAPASSF